LVLVCAVSLTAAGCSNSGGPEGGGFLSKPVEFFSKPEWAKPDSISRTGDLGPRGPIGPDDLVSADGRCSVAAGVPATAPETPPVAPVSGDAGAADASLGAPTVMGGIGLAMTECQVVQRAGTPGNVNIGAGDRGERSVVLTYLSGPWPGIYRFSDGRLKVIDRAPTPPAPAKKAPVKKKKAAKRTQ
jgi:hypothetical protein